MWHSSAYGTRAKNGVARAYRVEPSKNYPYRSTYSMTDEQKQNLEPRMVALALPVEETVEQRRAWQQYRIILAERVAKSSGFVHYSCKNDDMLDTEELEEIREVRTVLAIGTPETFFGPKKSFLCQL